MQASVKAVMGFKQVSDKQVEPLTMTELDRKVFVQFMYNVGLEDHKLRVTGDPDKFDVFIEDSRGDTDLLDPWAVDRILLARRVKSLPNRKGLKITLLRQGTVIGKLVWKYRKVKLVNSDGRTINKPVILIRSNEAGKGVANPLEPALYKAFKECGYAYKIMFLNDNKLYALPPNQVLHVSMNLR